MKNHTVCHLQYTFLIKHQQWVRMVYFSSKRIFFPRTVAQAEAMESFTDVDAALSIEVPDEAIVHRMAGRRTCPKCHATYHVEGNPPKVEGVCDKCGEKLGIRHDDDPEVVLQRLEVYHAQTEPVKEHYAQLGKLRSVEGIGSVDEIRKRIFDTLGLNV